MSEVTQVREDSKRSLAAEILLGGGSARLQVLGNSMLPSVWPGDVLVIEGTCEGVAVGDIVLFSREGRFFVHRIIEKRMFKGVPRWITRGDAMPQNDPPLASGELLGRVSAIHRNGRVIIPSRRVLPLHQILAWMLCHSDSIRNLAFRIHLVRAQRQHRLDLSHKEVC